MAFGDTMCLPSVSEDRARLRRCAQGPGPRGPELGSTQGKNYILSAADPASTALVRPLLPCDAACSRGQERLCGAFPTSPAGNKQSWAGGHSKCFFLELLCMAHIGAGPDV